MIFFILFFRYNEKTWIGLVFVNEINVFLLFKSFWRDSMSVRYIAPNV